MHRRLKRSHGDGIDGRLLATVWHGQGLSGRNGAQGVALRFSPVVFEFQTKGPLGWKKA